MKQEEIIQTLRDVVVKSQNYSALTTTTGTDGYPVYTLSTPHIVALVNRVIAEVLEKKDTLPLAWYDPTKGVVSADKDSALFTPLGQLWPLYSKQEWVGLTSEEIRALTVKKPLLLNYSEACDKRQLVRAVDSILQMKNK